MLVHIPLLYQHLIKAFVYQNLILTKTLPGNKWQICKISLFTWKKIISMTLLKSSFNTYLFTCHWNHRIRMFFIGYPIMGIYNITANELLWICTTKMNPTTLLTSQTCPWQLPTRNFWMWSACWRGAEGKKGANLSNVNLVNDQVINKGSTKWSNLSIYQKLIFLAMCKT